MESADIVVVGGGLAGLAAAALAARAGMSVALLEKAASVGGRARSRQADGFVLNQGPHALYRHGAAARVLDALGIVPRGGKPPAAGSLAWAGGALHELPVGPGSLLRTSLLTLREKAQVGLLLARLPRLDTRALRSVSLADWLEGEGLRGRTAGVLAALAALTTYSADPGRLSAGAAIEQIRLGQDGGVLYLDGGWQSLVDALREAAVACGVHIVAGRRVAALRAVGSSLVVETATGRLRARAALLAVPPAVAAALLGDEGMPQVGSLVPVRMASLDVALRRLPRSDRRFALGIERPLYLSVHSAAARLAPVGGAVVHAARYLATGEEGTDARAELEGLLDAVQPGWRAEVAQARFVPSFLVSNALVAARLGGTAGRPPAAVPGHPSVFLAGDWVGPEGHLADAALASAERAARLAVAALGAAAAASPYNPPVLHAAS